MSGPKTSNVYISPERQAYLERLRREKAQIIFEIKSKLQRLNNFDIRINDLHISNKLKLKLDALKKIFKETLNNMVRNANITNDLSTLEALNRNSTDVLNEFEDKYENIFKNIEDNINKIIEISSRNEKEEIASLIDKIPADKIEGSRSIILEIKDPSESFTSIVIPLNIIAIIISRMIIRKNKKFLKQVLDILGTYPNREKTDS